MEYICEICDFKTDRSHNLKAHNATVKHLRKSGLCELEKINNDKKYDNKLMEINISIDESSIDESTKYEKSVFQENDINHNNEKDNELKKNFKKVYKCKFCDKNFNHYQGRWTHEKTCKCKTLFVENKKTQDNVAKLTETVEELKSIILKQPNVITPPPININMTNNTTNNTNSHNNLTANTNNTMNMLSAVKYINKNYQIAPPLEMIESSYAKSMLTAKSTKEHTVEEFMIYHYNKELFAYFIGEIIKSEYKKDNPKIQQFWATDVSRLSFVVRQAIEKSDKIWINDKKGILLKKYIITPILTEVKLMVDKHYKYCKKQIKTNGDYLNLDTIEKLFDASITCDKISIEIANEVMHDSVLKYITPYFQLEL